MQPQANVLDCYNKTAQHYAAKFMDELQHKHLDRILLQAFAAENRTTGKMIDLGCGPGQTTRYLQEHGVNDLLGTDLSPEMVKVAQQAHPSLHFEVADMLALPYADGSFGAAVAFYAIVHFDEAGVKTAFEEIKRILKPDGQFLFSFHIGQQIVHLDNFLDYEVNVDFYFFEMEKITALLTETGFKLIDVMERQPYAEVEYASKRGYVWVG